MKPSHIIGTFIFLGIAVTTLLYSPSTVCKIQESYYNCITPFVISGSKMEKHIHHFFSELKTTKELESRLKAIEVEFEQLQATKARYLQIEKENKGLRSALDFRERSKFQLVSSQIIKRLPSSWWETVTLDKGEKNKIAPQYPVISEHGVVGKVDQVWDSIATVLLITDESCLVSAKIENSSEFGIIAGFRGSYGEDATLKMSYLTIDTKAQLGDRILTSGKGGIFPDNIQIGTIISLKKGPLYAEAMVKPSFDLNSVYSVFTILTPEQ